MITYHQALDLLQGKAVPAAAIQGGLAEALGAVAAADITVPFDLPGFDNSAMDGFALRRQDCVHAAPGAPITLPVQAVTAAGDKAGSLQDGHAIQIMTGAALPYGADSVIPIEDVGVTRNNQNAVTHITIQAPPRDRQNIRFCGEDFRKGDAVVKTGTCLNPHHIMALSTFGLSTVAIRNKPQAIVMATGNELHDSASKLSFETGIYNSNSPYLLAMLRQAGISAAYHGIIPDRENDFLGAMGKILDTRSDAPRLIISTGAVSKGDFDFIPQALKNVGAEIVFHKVAIKPGKPVLFALLPQGDYFFGLPGNPISTAVGLRFFVMPLVRSILGLPAEQPIMARLAQAHKAKPGMWQFLKARLDITPEGTAQASILPGQESFKIKPLLQANGWVLLDEQTQRLESGDAVAFIPAAPWGHDV